MLSFYQTRNESSQEFQDYKNIVVKDHLPIVKKLPLIRKSRKHFGNKKRESALHSPRCLAMEDGKKDS